MKQTNNDMKFILADNESYVILDEKGNTYFGSLAIKINYLFTKFGVCPSGQLEIMNTLIKENKAILSKPVSSANNLKSPTFLR